MVEKNLVSSTVDVLDIFDYHGQSFSEPADRRVKNFVLGYVTPVNFSPRKCMSISAEKKFETFFWQWNNKGYDRAVKFAKKFTHISPVWLQIHPGSGKGEDYVVKGTHDIDNSKQLESGEFREKIQQMRLFSNCCDPSSG